MRRNVEERNKQERLAAAVCMTAFVLLVALAGVFQAAGTPLYLIPDPNCVQPRWGLAVPEWADPNTMAGILIDVQTVEAGKWNRTGRYCDRQGDPVQIELLQGPPGMTATLDPNAMTWTLAGELPPGRHSIIVHAWDDPTHADPNDKVVTILVEATPRPNDPPALW